MKSYNTWDITLPETNIAPENRPSQKEISIPTIHFQVYVSFREYTTTQVFPCLKKNHSNWQAEFCPSESP